MTIPPDPHPEKTAAFRKELAEMHRQFDLKHGIHTPTWDEILASPETQQYIDEQVALEMAAREEAKIDFERRFPDIELPPNQRN